MSRFKSFIEKHIVADESRFLREAGIKRDYEETTGVAIALGAVVLAPVVFPVLYAMDWFLAGDDATQRGMGNRLTRDHGIHHKLRIRTLDITFDGQ